MKKFLTLLLFFFVLLSVFPTIPVQATVWPPAHPWLSEVIDGWDISVNGGISMTRLPGTNRLAVAYAGKRASLAYTILKFAMQVKPGTGNCGESQEWNCMDLDTNRDVGLNPSIAAFQDLNNKDTVYIGVSYSDADNLSLKYAFTLYDIKNDRLDSNWKIETVDGPAGIIAEAGRKSSLTYDLGTGLPVIAYNSYDDPAALGPAKWLNSATFVGEHVGNCGPLDSWNCVKIDSEPLAYTGALEDFGLGWINGKLYYFYKSVFGLDYASYGPGPSPCLNPDFFCGIIDRTITEVGYELKVSSWSGNLPGTPGYNASVPENGVNLVYRDRTNNRIKVASSQKPGSSYLFRVEDIAGSGVSSGRIGLAVTTDPNYYPAITFSQKSSSSAGNDIVIARPTAAYMYYSGGSCGTPLGNWICNTLLSADSFSSAGGYASIDVSPGNLVRIIFNSFNADVNTYGLQILRQDDYKTRLPLIRR